MSYDKTINGRDPNGEEAVLKTVGCKSFAGSTPVSSANIQILIVDKIQILV
jgi:hypothetical protein